MMEPLINSQHKKLQNIHACLVHENKDCILDLVRNLHYLDPDSIILLCNGSTDPNLIPIHFPFNNYGAVVIPDPFPVKYGYLHYYAFHCMQFALQNFSFDTITIVDSDQLAIKSGYSRYLSAFFSSRSNIGMLSNMPERLTSDDKGNHIALQAFKEYALWKPFLENFSNGESKFVHCTFWPSTVFTWAATRDLVELYEENRQLKEILKHSNIWASEEVILPTLVRLLGYDIASNPCSYDFVQYRKLYSILDLNTALCQKDAFWIHPIERRFDNLSRDLIRERFNY